MRFVQWYSRRGLGRTDRVQAARHDPDGYQIPDPDGWPENANDNAPLREGKSYRLSIVSVRATAETPENYADSLRRAWLLAYQHAKQHGREDCMAILARHAQGIYDRRRSTADH